MNNVSAPGGSFDIEDGPEEEVEDGGDATATPDAPRRRGRRRTQQSASAPTQTDAAPSPPADAVVPEKKKSPKRDDCPKDLEQAWPWILDEYLPANGWVPADINIQVIRISGKEPSYLEPKIRGDQVLGDTTLGVSSGTALKDWIVEFYHRDPGIPSTYRAHIYWAPKGESIVWTTQFHLDSIASIDARRKALEDTRRAGGGQGGVAYRTTPWSQPTPGFSPPPPAVPAPPVPGGELASMYQELGYLRAVKDENDRARAEGRAPREVAPPPPPAPAPPPPAAAPGYPSKEMMDQAIEYERQMADLKIAVEKAKSDAQIATMKAEMDARFRQLEQKAATNEPPLEERVAVAVAKQLAAMGIVGPGVAATAGATGTGAPAPGTPLNANDLIELGRRYNQAREQAKQAFGLTEEEEEKPDEPTKYIVETPGQQKGFMGQVMDFFRQLPPGSIPGTMAILSSVLSGSPAGVLVEKAAQAAQAAAEAASKGRGGSWGQRA